MNTKDEHTALREAEKLARKYQAEFKVLTDGAKATPADAALAGKSLAEQYDLDMFVHHAIEPLRAAYAQGDDHVYDIAEKQQRDWNSLIAVVGDIEFNDLSRVHARHVVDVLLQQGKKTTTVRGTITNLSPVTAAAIRELAVVLTNPFEKLGIQGEGQDAKESVVANQAQLQQIVAAMQGETNSAPALLALMQLEIGARIGELRAWLLRTLFLTAKSRTSSFKSSRGAL